MPAAELTNLERPVRAVEVLAQVRLEADGIQRLFGPDVDRIGVALHHRRERAGIAARCEVSLALISRRRPPPMRSTETDAFASGNRKS